MDSLFTPASGLALLGLTLIILYVRSISNWNARTRGRSLPPGPPPLPLIGNILDVPTYKPWRGYRALCAQYGMYRETLSLRLIYADLDSSVAGEMVYMHVLGSPILVVDSAELANELLNKRSANTPDRSPNPVIEL